MNDNEKNESLIVIFIAETDKNYVHAVAREVRLNFIEHLSSGFIEIIAPSSSFYSRLDNLRTTLDDSPKRVRWRSKQVLDAAFLMSYARNRSQYFLMLEDDVTSKRNFFRDMKNYVEHLNKVFLKNPWKIIKISPVGNVATLFRSEDLMEIVTFMNLFFNDKPIDWLLEDFLNVKYCSPEIQRDKCEKIKSRVRFTSNGFFNHKGKFSSLKGKISQVAS